MYFNLWSSQLCNCQDQFHNIVTSIYCKTITQQWLQDQNNSHEEQRESHKWKKWNKKTLWYKKIQSFWRSLKSLWMISLKMFMNWLLTNLKVIRTLHCRYSIKKIKIKQKFTKHKLYFMRSTSRFTNLKKLFTRLNTLCKKTKNLFMM